MIDERRLHCTDEAHMQPIISGDGLDIHLGTTGQDTQVFANGEPLVGVRGLRLEVRAGSEPATIALDMIELGKRDAVLHRFVGYFVSPPDYDAFLAWKRDAQG